MQIVGKHTIKVFDKRNKLIHEDFQYNVVTTKGRERILDIWSFNLNPSSSMDKNLYGIEMIDTSPFETGIGTRRCTFFDSGTMLDPYDDSGGRSLDSYNSYLTASGASEDEVDEIFIPGNKKAFRFSGGPPGNSDSRSYWNNMDLARVDSEESFVVDLSSGDQTINLTGSNLKYDYNSNKEHSLKIWNASKTASFVYGTDFTFDRALGTVVILDSGNIIDSSTIRIQYIWHDTSIFDDGVVGVYMRGWPDFYYQTMYYRSFLGRFRASAHGGEQWLPASIPWNGKPHNQFFGYTTDSNDAIIMGMLTENLNNNDHDHYWFHYPYILNKPTNMSFLAGFSYSDYIMQNFNFYKPVFNPQTPRVIALGIDNTASNVSDTALGNEVLRLDVVSTDRPSDGVGKWVAYLDYDEYAGILFKEVGLFHGDRWLESEDPGWSYVIPIQKDSCNELFSRTVYSTPWQKTNEQRVEIGYELTLV